MTFDASAYLRKATSRAKSDVANKLVSMFLHEVSRRITTAIGLSVTDSSYTEAVTGSFGHLCGYCNRILETDRAAVEHLDGMNRFRVGLHVPGNVVVACNRCNREKRRDDSLPKLILAESGWESFLSHNGTMCAPSCLTCSYWRAIYPVEKERQERMRLSRSKIASFRAAYPKAMQWGTNAKLVLQPKLEIIYRECQEFATVRINEAVEILFAESGSFQSVFQVGTRSGSFPR